MVGRTYSAPITTPNGTSTIPYSFGFNGQLKDDEVYGAGNSIDFGARIYDSRLGRFLSVDPKAIKFPWASPYSFGNNNPILFVDNLGEEPSLSAYKKASERLGVPVASVRAVYQSEVGGNAYFNGRAKILFERHYFHRFTNGKFDESNPNISNSTAGGYGTYNGEYAKLEEAMKLDREAAFKSASYGGFQIMGSNYKNAGFESAEEMHNALTSDNEDLHLEAFTNFILNDKSINLKKGITMTKLEALQSQNWTQFAMGYNGPNQKNYDTKMEDNFNKFKDNELEGLKDSGIDYKWSVGNETNKEYKISNNENYIHAQPY